MKKLICLLTVLCLLMTLSACNPSEEPTTSPTSEPTLGSTEPTPSYTDPSTKATTDPTTEPTVESVVYDLPMTAISVTEMVETTQNDDGVTIFEYHYPNIRLVLPDPQMTHTINMDILNRIDSTRSEAESIRADAANLGVGPVPFSYYIRYTPQRTDSVVLSLICFTNSYTGGQGVDSSSGLTYDLSTGNVLTLADVLTENVTADVICRMAVDALSVKADELYLFDDFHLYVEDRFSGDFLADESWHLSREGLCFTFAPYEIAPNSSGFVQAVIPYEKLSGILEDTWFPEEKVSPNGELEVSPFLEHNEGFDQFAELNLDRIGGSYLLHSTGLIYDVIIETGFWNMNGTIFTAENIVFQAGSLVPSDAIRIQADIPDTLPNLRITYTGQSGPVSVFLSARGEDGSPLLLTY